MRVPYQNQNQNPPYLFSGRQHPPRWVMTAKSAMMCNCWGITKPSPSMGMKLSSHNSFIRITHWGRVTHVYVSKIIIIGSVNGLSPGWHPTIIWTNAGIMLIGPLGTNFSQILIENIYIVIQKMHFKMSSANWRPSCPRLNEITGRQCGNQLTRHRRHIEGQQCESFDFRVPAVCSINRGTCTSCQPIPHKTW